MASPFQFDGNVTFIVSVSDLERAAAFYRETLGLQQVMFSPEFNWAQFESGVPGAFIGMGVNTENLGVSNSSIGFGVRDIEAARAELERRGVTFEGDIMEVPGQVRLATFADPDGNTLMLSQRLA
jgi:predicted enzyme related to lactoylglutathione lyase